MKKSHEAIRLVALMAGLTSSIGFNSGFGSYFDQRMEDFSPLEDDEEIDIPSKLVSRNSNDV